MSSESELQESAMTSGIQYRNKIAAFAILLGRKPGMETLKSLAVRSDLETIKRIVVGDEFAKRIVLALKEGRALPHDRRDFSLNEDSVRLFTGTLNVRPLETREYARPRHVLASVFAHAQIQAIFGSWLDKDALPVLIEWSKHYLNNFRHEAQPPHRSGHPREREEGTLDREQVEHLLQQPADSLIRHLKSADSIGALPQIFAKLYEEKYFSVLSRLFHDPTIPLDITVPLRFYSNLYYGRIALDMNAADTACTIFEALLTGDTANAPLNENLPRLRKFMARAALRAGQPARAVSEWRQISFERPLDWEPYFHMGSIQGVSDAAARRSGYALAYALGADLSEPVICTLIEALIDDRQFQDAIIMALQAMKRRPHAHQFWVSLANIALARGDREEWAQRWSGYFRSYSLEPPRFEGTGEDPTEPKSVFARLGTANSHRYGGGPRIRVIMTSYCAEATIELAMRSVLCQTHSNLELVVIDDCSPDNARELVRKIASEDPRVSFLQNDRNCGTYASKNKALACDAEFITFHDSDDWMHPQRLERQLPPLLADSKVMATNSRWIRVDEQGRAIVRRAGGFEHENPASTLIRRSVFGQIGLFDAVRTGADSEFLWRMRNHYGHKNIVNVPEPLTLGLHRIGSLTQSGSTAFDEHRFSRVRLDYWEAWVNYHLKTLASEQPDLALRPGDMRSFSAPGSIKVDL